ncbi:hypothetical protein DYQ86_08675 [Acidobacteria bacterium AB60]|nr:hypothetical protein DYQ86_08675 [Acidobacteria bacterium AB60]
MDDETREQFKQLTEHIETRFQQEREYTDERTRDMETTLLTDFRKWGQRIEATMKPTPPRISSLEDRVALVEQRLDDMERPKQ